MVNLLQLHCVVLFSATLLLFFFLTKNFILLSNSFDVKGTFKKCLFHLQYVYILVTVKGMNTSETHLKRLLTNELFWPCLTAGQVLFTLVKIDGEPTQMRPEDPWIEDPWSEKLWAKDYWSYPSPATAVGQPAPLLHSTSSTAYTIPHFQTQFFILFFFCRTENSFSLYGVLWCPSYCDFGDCLYSVKWTIMKLMWSGNIETGIV